MFFSLSSRCKTAVHIMPIYMWFIIKVPICLFLSAKAHFCINDCTFLKLHFLHSRNGGVRKNRKQHDSYKNSLKMLNWSIFKNFFACGACRHRRHYLIFNHLNSVNRGKKFLRAPSARNISFVWQYNETISLAKKT